MLKKLILLSIVVLLYNCATVDVKDRVFEGEDQVIENAIINTPEDVNKIRESLSNHVLANADTYYSDFAALILDLIRKKNWETLSAFTNKMLYKDYVVKYDGLLVDYATFMLHTGDEGISPHYSIDEIHNAFYTDSYPMENYFVFEGLYIYSADVTEFFKIIIEDTDEGLIITRE